MFADPHPLWEWDDVGTIYKKSIKKNETEMNESLDVHRKSTAVTPTPYGWVRVNLYKKYFC